MGKRNYIDVDWPDLFKPIPGLDQEKYNRIRINREVIPIIFVPGIMGSRLKNKKTGEIVWDPDREIMCMLRKYGGFWNTPAQRKRMLIGDTFHPEYLEVDVHNGNHNRKISALNDQHRASRGWGGVYWASYGKFLEVLHNHQWEAYDPLLKKAEAMVGKCFEFPVYAFGYNWTDSNLSSGNRLADKIDEILNQYRSKDRLCNQVILISHSMGGMVCRSACKLHEAEHNVLGVIHGVQPASGAPAAYWRMKAGFERTGGTFLQSLQSRISAWVLGTNGEEVTCILGNAPGGLELLPNKHYTDNLGNERWLRVRLKGGHELRLPQRGNPYEEIYRIGSPQYYRLINPDWLQPADDSDETVIPWKEEQSAWEKYLACLKIAEQFHDRLKKQLHPCTYQFYSSGINTADDVNFIDEVLELSTRYEAVADAGATPYIKLVEPSKYTSSRGQSVMHVDDEEYEVATVYASPPPTRVITMAHPDGYHGGGDGTVPESSGKSLEVPKGNYTEVTIEHQSAFSDPKAVEFVLISIRKIAAQLIRKKQSQQNKESKNENLN